MHISTKTYCHNIGLSCCFRQWRAKSHCRFLHGYALEVRVEFATEELDVNKWVVDFGGLKSFKTVLEQNFDHKLLIAFDDPDYEKLQALAAMDLAQTVAVQATGCEAFAEMIHTLAKQWLIENSYWPRVRVHKVEVREHAGNSAMYMENPS